MTTDPAFALADDRPPDPTDDRPPRRLTPMESADILVMFLTRRREILIIELREVDRLLGRVQTVPERNRGGT